VRERGRLSLSLSVEWVRSRLIQHLHPHLLLRRQCLLRHGLRHGLLVASPHLAVRVHFARFRASAVVLAIAHHHRPPPCHQALGFSRIRLCTPPCTRLSRRNQTTRRVRACCRAQTRAALSATTHPLAAVPGLDSRAPQARPMLAASDVALADGAPATDPRVILINLGESQTARRVAPNGHALLRGGESGERYVRGGGHGVRSSMKEKTPRHQAQRRSGSNTPQDLTHLHRRPRRPPHPLPQPRRAQLPPPPPPPQSSPPLCLAPPSPLLCLAPPSPLLCLAPPPLCLVAFETRPKPNGSVAALCARGGARHQRLRRTEERLRQKSRDVREGPSAPANPVAARCRRRAAQPAGSAPMGAQGSASKSAVKQGRDGVEGSGHVVCAAAHDELRDAVLTIASPCLLPSPLGLPETRSGAILRSRLQVDDCETLAPAPRLLPDVLVVLQHLQGMSKRSPHSAAKCDSCRAAAP